jgi:hypothetical protein
MARMTSWVHRYTPRELMDDSFDLFKERALDLLIAGLLPGCLIAIYWVLARTFVFPGNLLTEFSLEKIEELTTMWQFWVYIVVLPSVVVVPATLSLALILQCRVAVRHVLGDDFSVARAFGLLAKPFFSSFIVAFVFVIAQSVVALVASAVSMFVVGIFAAIGGFFLVASAASGATSVVGYVFIAIAYAVGIMLSMAIYLGVCVMFLTAPVALACEHAGPFKAIGQSFSIAQSNYKPHFIALYVIVHAPVIIVVLLLTLAAVVYALLQNNMPLSFEITLSLFGLVMTAACTGLLACLQALVYIDGRCRRDSLDLQLLAAGIGLGETFARLYTPGAGAPQVLYPNYAGAPQAGLPGQPAVMPPPRGTALPPAAAGSPPASAYPDYSAPPPLLGGAGPEPPPAYPDYSAPPPPLEPADAPPAKPAGWVEPAGGAETDTQREGADVP